jgi:hypothetical protein
VSLGSRLGDATTRRRRHVRVALLGAALLAVGALLVFAVDDGDEPSTEFTGAAAAECEAFSERIDREFELLFPDEPPGEAAVAEYLSRAFADTMDELVATLRGLDGSEVAEGAIDDLAERLAEVRADPGPFARRERLVAEGIAEQFDELGLPACGSEFLAGPS